jgi:hypothetical protein
MFRSVLNALFGCFHRRTTFPLTPSRKPFHRGTYVVCLNCGKEFDYDWNEMRRGQAVLSATLPTTRNSAMRLSHRRSHD